MKGVATVLLTSERETNYFDLTLKNISESGFFAESGKILDVVLGGPSAAYLRHHRSDPRLRFRDLPLGEPALAAWTRLRPQSRCAYGHYRCMTEAFAIEGNWEHLLVLEDDLTFSDGWMTFLEQLIPPIQAKHGDRWILSLYRLLEGTRDAFLRGERYFHFTKPFWGTQAVLYPRSLLPELAQYLLRHCVESYREPVDDSIGTYCETIGIPTLASAPSLVNHIGELSTGQSGSFHKATFYLETVRGL